MILKDNLNIVKDEMEKTALGDRIKGYYENRYRDSLPRRTNTIIRVDGKAFHTLTRGMLRPFDPTLMVTMQRTALYMCERIQGAKMAYIQSDEISMLLTDYDDIKTDAWFDGNIQKICSVSASLATVGFNLPGGIGRHDACFDSRVFIIPEIEEVCNYFIWRQKDAERNSINMVAQALYSHKELQGKSIQDVHELLHQKGINWNNYSAFEKRGACVVRNSETRNWEVVEPPIFTQDREFIKKIIIVNLK